MTEKLDTERLAHRIVEAAIRNEQTLTTTIGELKKIQVDLRSVTNKTPDIVSERVNRILDEVVTKASSQIIKKFTDAEQKAAELSNHYDRLLKGSFWKLYLLVTASALTTVIVILSAAHLIWRW